MSKQTTPDAFTQWVVREMPAGTEIGDPEWWAPRLWRAAESARKDVATPAPDAVTLPEGVDAAIEAFASVRHRVTVESGGEICPTRGDLSEAMMQAHDDICAEIAAALAAEREARDAAERELRRIARWVGAEPNEGAFDAVARCKTAREVAEHRLAAAEARVRELEADAARLNFVQREGLRCGAWYSDDGEGVVVAYFCETPETGDEALGPTLRAAIDAALNELDTAAREWEESENG